MAPAPMPTTRDAFLGGRLLLTQPSCGPRAGIEAVLLAAACPVAGNETVLDAGAGAGVVGLCVAARVPGARVHGVEIDAGLARLAADNAAASGLAERCRFEAGDLTALPWPGERAAHVVCNPPFHTGGTPSPDARLARAHRWQEGDARRWVLAMAAACRPRATLTLVIRAEAVPHWLAATRGLFGGFTLLPLWPRLGTPAKLALLHGRRGGRSPFALAPGLVLHDAGGGFTPAANAILREGAALPLP